MSDSVFTDGQRHNVAGPGLFGYSLDSYFSDSADLPKPIRRFRVAGTAGDVKVLYVGASDDEPHTIPDLQQYEVTDAHIRRIFANGTTATGIDGWT